MRIAVIAWGSLIWCPGGLALSSRWHADGPFLPIEFSRISSDGRLTLVIHPGAREVRTYWAGISIDELVAARENLAQREGTDISNVAFRIREGQLPGNCTNAIGETISNWLAQTDIDAAIWTNLESNFEDLEHRAFTAENALAYILRLQSNQAERATYRRAREYIQNAPAAVQTEVRELLRTRARIDDNHLSAVLFET